MARLFDATTDRLSNTTFPAVTTAAGTIFTRVKPNWNYNDSAIHVIWHHGNASHPTVDECPIFQKFSDNNIYIGFNNAGSGDQRIAISGSGCFSNGVWQNHLFTWNDSANELFYYCDNTQMGTRTSALTPFGNVGLCVGNYLLSWDVGKNLDGSLAEYARWNRTLTSTERSALQATGDPASVPEGLTHHLRFEADGNTQYSEVSTSTLTNTNTVQSNHPTTYFDGGYLQMRIPVPVVGGRNVGPDFMPFFT